jgi:hypothetical protein
MSIKPSVARPTIPWDRGPEDDKLPNVHTCA